MARIERLYHQTGGKQVGVVFLLPGAESMEEGTRALMELQIRYVYIVLHLDVC